jgi:hypothetical protein
MKNIATSLAVGCGVLVCASVALAQAEQKTDQTPRFEEALVVSAPPTSVTGTSRDALDYYMTFGGPVAIPGVTLAAGTYLFQFPAGPGSDVIQVLKPDRSDVYAMFSATRVVDTRRTIFSDGGIVLLKDGQPGAAPRIKEWYLPGRTTGFEFLYPRQPE